jgi:hypothetical protein
MKRFKLILAVAATMLAIMAFSAVPPMAAPEDHFFDDDFFLDGDGFGDFEQESESGDVHQSFELIGTDDNSN